MMVTNLKGYLKKERSREKVLQNSKMEIFIMDNLRMIKLQVLVNWFFKMEDVIKDILRMGK